MPDRISNLRRASLCWEEALPVLALIVPATALSIGVLHGSVLLELGDADAALSVWHTALAQRETMMRAGLSFETRSDAAQRAGDLIYRLALLELSHGEVGAAVATLERGRALGLREALALDDAWLDGLPGAERMRILVARERLAGLRAGPPSAELGLHPSQVTAWEQEVRAAEAELLAAQDSAGFTPPTHLDGRGLSALAPVGGAVVLLTAGPDGGAAVVLPAGGVLPAAEHVVTLPDASTEALRDMLVGWMSAYGEMLKWRRTARWWSALLSANAVLAGVLDRLWTAVMGPVLAKTAELGITHGAELVLLPQGDLAQLPLHAAWREVDGVRRSVLDEHVISYTPSGASLRTARQRLSRLQANSSATAGTRDRAGLFGLFNPMRGTDHALPLAETVEMPALRQVFHERGLPERCLAGDESSVEAVLGDSSDDAPGAAEAGYLHLSCHGSFNGQEPERSGLQLAGDALLSVRDVVRHLRLRQARWVALSACETGMVDVEHLPDEFVGMPAALLQAGAPGVVATLWSVLDGPTALLMPKLYEHHLGERVGARGEDPVRLEPAAALRRAVLWLQEMSWEEMQAALNAAATSAGAVPVPVAPGAARDTRRDDASMVEFGATEDSSPGTPAGMRLRDLPVIWAAYTFHGA